jgi:ribosomal protein L24E
MKKEALEEAQLSAAIARDIIDRHLQADVEINTKACPCGFCRKTISRGKPAIFVQSFERKDTDVLALCDKDCTDAHEVLEMEFFGCHELEKLPALVGKPKKMKRSDLLDGYNQRLAAAMQNALDKRKIFHEAYQVEEPE